MEAILSRQFSDCCIVHVGSTAIPDCFAKLILDVVLWYNPKSSFQNETKVLVEIGFTAKGEYGVPGRCFFNFYDSKKIKDYVHIHAFPIGHANGLAMLSFRDRLLIDKNLVQSYSRYKQRLVEQGVSRKNYPDAKTGFICDVLKMSRD